MIEVHFTCFPSRASELAFALEPLPKNELPPSPPFIEVCALDYTFNVGRSATRHFVKYKSIYIYVNVSQPKCGNNRFYG